MLRGTERFLTTHTGSLPRPDDLIAMMVAREEGVPVDEAALDKRVTAAIGEMVRLQSEAGVDIVNDGEMSKPSYATYVKDRLNGFGGTGNSFVFQDLVGFPKSQVRVFGDPGRKTRKTPGCNGPISVRDLKSPKVDVENLTACAAGAKIEGLFSSAASPGVISLFFRNDYYKSHEEYLYAIAEAMRYEYETIAHAGMTLQLDCPDLAMSRHTGYQALSEAEFLQVAAANVEALNAATARIAPERMRMHVCWGNYEGPHDCDIALEKVIGIILRARPATILFEAANPRHEHEWKVWAGARIPQDKILAPGLIDTCSNYVEHPELIAQRIERYAGIVGADRVVASTDCGFGTFAGYGKIDPGVTWKKLLALRAGADIAAARLGAQAVVTA